MHHALNIDELLSAIFIRVNDTSSLCSIARVCKIFNPVAIRIIWRCLTYEAVRESTFDSLLSLFPEDLLSFSEASFVQPPRPRDWNRFLHYSVLVRELKYDEQPPSSPNRGPIYVNPELFQDIAIYKPVHYILPNLDELHWRCKTLQGLQSALLFITPNLVHFDLSAGPKITLDRLALVLATVEDISQSLISLAISHGSHHSESIKQLDNLLLSFASLIQSRSSTLQDFYLSMKYSIPNGMFRKVLQALGNLPRLQGLTIIVGNTTTDNSWDLPDPEDVGAHRAFPSLREVQLEAPASICQYVLSRISSPEVYSVSLSLDTFHGISAVTTSIPLPTRAFAVSISSATSCDIYASTGRHFLVRCPHLIDLDISTQSLLSLDDEVIKEMATAWPALERLSILPRQIIYDSNRPARPTLLAIEFLTSRCPKLRSLSLCIDAREVPGNTVASNSTHTATMNDIVFDDTRQISWFVGPSLIDSSSSKQVGSFLRNCLPRNTRWALVVTAQNWWDFETLTDQGLRVSTWQTVLPHL